MAGPELPPITNDIDEAKTQFEEFGLTRLGGCLTDEQVRAIRARLDDQALAERQAGVATIETGRGTHDLSKVQDDAPNQRVWGLLNKGDEFVDLAINPNPIQMMRRIFGESYGLRPGLAEGFGMDEVLLSSLTANIAGPGGEKMDLHMDQFYIPPSIPFTAVINIVWMIDEFTADNGATLVAPGSHKAEKPLKFLKYPPETAPATGPAGTALIFDGRLWHATGANTTAAPRRGILAYYARPFIRQQENYMLTLDRDVAAKFPDELKRMLGLKVWHSLGMVGWSAHGHVHSLTDTGLSRMEPEGALEPVE
ncbi:MAG: phytanoyl-CoA dioxygenase family protein [Pseudomonadota bacterium]